MTEKYQPKQGDRVRVVLEGEARYPAHDGSFDIRSAAGAVNYIMPNADHVVSIEKLADPEPEWVHGAVVRVKGQAYAFWHDGRGIWRVLGGEYDFSYVVRGAWECGELTILWNGDDK